MPSGLDSRACRLALFDDARGALRLTTADIGPAEAGAVLVKVICCTLCGSDLKTRFGERPCPTPAVLGHEILGEVVDVGEGVRAAGDGGPLLPGERVTWTLTASCGRCFFCLEGRREKCEHVFKYGHEQHLQGGAPAGGLSEYCSLRPGTAVFRVPVELSDEVAAPANCATATAGAVLRAAGMGSSGLVLIQGAGLLGLTACAWARQRGWTPVVCDVAPARLELARQFGAESVFDARHAVDAMRAAVRDLSDGRGCDAVLELSGSVDALAEGVGLLRTGGTYVLAGTVAPVGRWSVDPEDVVRRHLTMRGVHNYRAQDLEQALGFLVEAGERFPFAQVVGRTFALADVDAAFAAARTGDALRIAVRPDA